MNLVELGKEMFKAGTSLKGKTMDQIFYQDYKRFTIGKRQIGVAQVNTMDIEGFEEYRDEMLAYMNTQVEAQHLDAAFVLLTDVINAASQLFVAGPKAEIAARAFKVTIKNSEAFLPGIISRKKQVIPAITEAIGQMG